MLAIGITINMNTPAHIHVGSIEWVCLGPGSNPVIGPCRVKLRIRHVRSKERRQTRRRGGKLPLLSLPLPLLARFRGYIFVGVNNKSVASEESFCRKS